MKPLFLSIFFALLSFLTAITAISETYPISLTHLTSGNLHDANIFFSIDLLCHNQIHCDPHLEFIQFQLVDSASKELIWSPNEIGLQWYNLSTQVNSGLYVTYALNKSQDGAAQTPLSVPSFDYIEPIPDKESIYKLRGTGAISFSSPIRSDILSNKVVLIVTYTTISGSIHTSFTPISFYNEFGPNQVTFDFVQRFISPKTASTTHPITKPTNTFDFIFTITHHQSRFTDLQLILSTPFSISSGLHCTINDINKFITARVYDQNRAEYTDIWNIDLEIDNSPYFDENVTLIVKCTDPALSSLPASILDPNSDNFFTASLLLTRAPPTISSTPTTPSQSTFLIPTPSISTSSIASVVPIGPILPITSIPLSQTEAFPLAKFFRPLSIKKAIFSTQLSDDQTEWPKDYQSFSKSTSIPFLSFPNVYKHPQREKYNDPLRFFDYFTYVSFDVELADAFNPAFPTSLSTLFSTYSLSIDWRRQTHLWAESSWTLSQTTHWTDKTPSMISSFKQNKMGDQGEIDKSDQASTQHDQTAQDGSSNSSESTSSSIWYSKVVIGSGHIEGEVPLNPDSHPISDHILSKPFKIAVKDSTRYIPLDIDTLDPAIFDTYEISQFLILTIFVKLWHDKLPQTGPVYAPYEQTPTLLLSRSLPMLDLHKKEFVLPSYLTQSHSFVFRNFTMQVTSDNIVIDINSTDGTNLNKSYLHISQNEMLENPTGQHKTSYYAPGDIQLVDFGIKFGVFSAHKEIPIRQDSTFPNVLANNASLFTTSSITNVSETHYSFGFTFNFTSTFSSDLTPVYFIQLSLYGQDKYVFNYVGHFGGENVPKCYLNGASLDLYNEHNTNISTLPASLQPSSKAIFPANEYTTHKIYLKLPQTLVVNAKYGIECSPIITPTQYTPQDHETDKTLYALYITPILTPKIGEIQPFGDELWYARVPLNFGQGIHERRFAWIFAVCVVFGSALLVGIVVIVLLRVLIWRNRKAKEAQEAAMINTLSVDSTQIDERVGGIITSNDPQDYYQIE